MTVLSPTNYGLKRSRENARDLLSEKIFEKSEKKLSLSPKWDSDFSIILSSKENHTKGDTTMTDKLLRWIADLCLIFDEDLDGDFPDDEYVLAHRAARKDPSPAVVDVSRPVPVPRAG